MDFKGDTKKKRTSVIKGILIWALVLMATPALIRGELLYLKDGSTIRGTVAGFQGDTLTFATSYGARVRVHRSHILKIVFDEEAGEPESVPQVKTGGSQALTAEGTGRLAVVFKNDEISSKIGFGRGQSEEDFIRANWIIQYLIVEGDTVYSSVDSTMDKTIFKGHKTIVKNSIRLEGFTVDLPTGVHQCILRLENRGATTHATSFENDPLELHVQIDNVQIFSDRTTSVAVGVNKGRLRMGRPQFYIVN